MEIINQYIAIKIMKLGISIHNIGVKIASVEWGATIHLIDGNVSIVKRLRWKNGEFATEVINLPLELWQCFVQKISFKE